MELIIAGVIVITILSFLSQNPKILVGILAFGAIGFVIGSYFSEGWSLFGTIFGAVLAYAGAYEEE